MGEMLKTTGDKYQKISNRGRDQGRQRKTSENRRKSQRQTESSNSLRQGKQADLWPQCIHMVAGQRNRLRGRGLSQGKISICLYAQCNANREQSLPVSPSRCWTALIFRLTKELPTHLRIASSWSTVALCEPSHLVIPVPVLIIIFLFVIIIIIITLSFLSVNYSTHMWSVVLSDITFSCFCVLCKFTANKYRRLRNYKQPLLSREIPYVYPNKGFHKISSPQDVPHFIYL